MISTGLLDIVTSLAHVNIRDFRRIFSRLLKNISFRVFQILLRDTAIEGDGGS